VSFISSGTVFSEQAASKLVAIQTVIVFAMGEDNRGAVVEIVLIEAGYNVETAIHVVAIALFIAIFVFSTNLENLFGCLEDSLTFECSSLIMIVIIRLNILFVYLIILCNKSRWER